MEYLERSFTLQMVFLNSLSQKHTETIKDFKEGLTPEEIDNTMQLLAHNDLPDENGVYQCIQPVSAKIIEKRIKPLFKVVNPDLLMPPLPKPKPIHPLAVVKNKKIQTILTVRELLHRSAVHVLKVMKNDREVNGKTPECLNRFFVNALRSQITSDLLPRKRKLHPFLFNPLMKDLFDQAEWDDVMIFHLPNLKRFFREEQWLQLMERYQTIGREATARLFSDNKHFPDYQKADKLMHSMLVDAQERHEAYLERGRQLRAKYPRIVG